MKINKKLRSMVKARNTGDKLFLLIMIFAFISACITKERVLAIAGIQFFALLLMHTGYFRTRAYHDALKRDSLVKIDPNVKAEVMDTHFTLSNLLVIITVIICSIVFAIVSDIAFNFGLILSTIASFIIGLLAMMTGYLLRWGLSYSDN
jgi:hypothetical protein